jgi:hypothetical protein
MDSMADSTNWLDPFRTMITTYDTITHTKSNTHHRYTIYIAHFPPKIPLR